MPSKSTINCHASDPLLPPRDRLPAGIGVPVLAMPEQVHFQSAATSAGVLPARPLLQEPASPYPAVGGDSAAAILLRGPSGESPLAAALLYSLTNRVYVAVVDGQAVVQKRFARHGIRNQLTLNGTRIRVEAHLQRWFRCPESMRFGVVTPALLHEDVEAGVLLSRWIPGRPLTDCPYDEWPGPESWFALGGWFAWLERASEDIMRGLPADVWQAQAVQAVRVVDRRLLGINGSRQATLQEHLRRVGREPRVICLGDASPANLRVSGDELAVVDYEFASPGFEGRDVGRLATQLNVHAIQNVRHSEFLFACRHMLFSGYERAGGNLANALIWALILEGYYTPDYSGASSSHYRR